MFHGIIHRGDGWFRLLTSLELNEADKVLEEFSGGPYWPAFLEHFFPEKYRVEVRKMDTTWVNKVRSQEPKSSSKLAEGEVLRWSNSTNQYVLRIKGATPNEGQDTLWLSSLNDIGLILGNSKKMSKRLAEIVRLTPMWTFDDKNTVKWEVIDHIARGCTDSDVDGISAVGQDFVIRSILNNHIATEEWKADQISKVLSGDITVVQLRVMTYKGLIKGNALVLPDEMMKGFDIRTFEPNIKTEVKTNGWLFATIEPSYGAIPIKSDDLTNAIYQNVSGMYTKQDNIECLENALAQTKEDLRNGRLSSYMTALVDNNEAIHRSDESEEEDQFRRGKSTLHMMQSAIRDLTELGIPFESTQTLRFLAANGVSMQFLSSNPKYKSVGNTWRDKSKHWFPVAWGYSAHVMTYEALSLFGFSLTKKPWGFYHKQTHCFVVPGEYFAKHHVNHGGDDLDDTWKIHVRRVKMPNGEVSLMAVILRNPNDFGEWSMIPIVKYGPVFHNYTDQPPMVEYNDLFSKVPQVSYLLSKQHMKPGTLPTVSNLNAQYSLADEGRSRLATLALPGGTGAATLPKIMWYALMQTWIDNPVASNEEIIDILEQGGGNAQSIKMISDWVKKTYIELIKTNGLNGTKMDLFWMATRLPKIYAEKIESTTVEESEWCQMHVEREMLVRTAVAEMVEYLNETLVEPEVLMNIEWDADEMLKIAKEFTKLNDKYRVSTPKDWVPYLCGLFKKLDENPEKGESYTNRKVLALAYHAYVMKRQYPKANHDQWLYTFSATSDCQPIDWLIRALRELNAE